jgi:hypothetical protein
VARTRLDALLGPQVRRAALLRPCATRRCARPVTLPSPPSPFPLPPPPAGAAGGVRQGARPGGHAPRHRGGARGRLRLLEPGPHLGPAAPDARAVAAVAGRRRGGQAAARVSVRPAGGGGHALRALVPAGQGAPAGGRRRLADVRRRRQHAGRCGLRALRGGPGRASGRLPRPPAAAVACAASAAGAACAACAACAASLRQGQPRDAALQQQQQVGSRPQPLATCRCAGEQLRAARQAQPPQPGVLAGGALLRLWPGRGLLPGGPALQQARQDERVLRLGAGLLRGRWGRLGWRCGLGWAVRGASVLAARSIAGSPAGGHQARAASCRAPGVGGA